MIGIYLTIECWNKVISERSLKFNNKMIIYINNKIKNYTTGLNYNIIKAWKGKLIQLNYGNLVSNFLYLRYQKIK